MNEKRFYVFGDLNICNILSEITNDPTRLLKSISELCQFTQLITEQTKITKHCKPLIDVMYTNTSNRVVQSGGIHIGIGDHGLIYIIRKIAIPVKTKHRVIKSRNCKHFDANNFCSDLELLPW